MTKDDFLKVGGFKEKMSEKLYSALEQKRENIDCITLMAASNTLGRGIGATKIKLIVEAFPKIISHDYIPLTSELVTLNGIEQKTASLFVTNLPIFFKFKKDNGLDCLTQASTKDEKKGAKFKDEIVVFTGFRSKVLEDHINNLQGRVSTTITKKTTLVIRKDDEESTKVDKARLLEIKIINLTVFEKENGVTAK